MMCLRPRRSASSEEKGEMSPAKRAVDEVMMDLSREVRCRSDSEVSIETRVAEMTPVSSAGRGKRGENRKLAQSTPPKGEG